MHHSIDPPLFPGDLDSCRTPPPQHTLLLTAEPTHREWKQVTSWDCVFMCVCVCWVSPWPMYWYQGLAGCTERERRPECTDQCWTSEWPGQSNHRVVSLTCSIHLKVLCLNPAVVIILCLYWSLVGSRPLYVACMLPRLWIVVSTLIALIAVEYVHSV